MEWKKLIKPSAVALGCAGAAVAAPFLAPYLATVSLPFFGAVLASVFKAGDFNESFGRAIVNTATGMLTNLGSAAVELIPGTLSSEHNYHLEKMLATAYLDSLAAVAAEIEAHGNEELRAQATEVLPLLRARIERGLRTKELASLFPLQLEPQPADTAFANRFSAEKISLLIADEERWRAQLAVEVEIALRRWLNEERAEQARAAQQTQLGLAADEQLPEPLRSCLCVELPPLVAHRISELVKREDFKESWIAFQRAHLQGTLRVLESIETSQADIRQSVDALTQRIAAFANQDDLVAAIADKLQVFLSQTSLPQAALTQLLEQQSEELREELRGVEERLGAKIDESKKEVIVEIREATDELKEEIRQSAIRAAQHRLTQLPAPLRDFTGREAELAELRQALRQGGVTISGVQGMGGVGKTVLALQLAHEFKDQYPDAQIYLDLKGVSRQPLTPAEVMWHVVSSFQPEMRRPDDDELPALYHALLNSNRVLLFYDNAKDAAQVAPLLPPENCLLLVTSRKHFTLPDMFDKNLDEMTEAEAIKLLLRIAARIGEHAAAIAEQCGYLPIALRAAGSVLKVKHSLSPEDYLKNLRDKKERLKLHDALRNLTVEACFDLSYESLTEELQRRWRMLAIFPTDFDALAAAAVWRTETDAAKGALAELEEYSLLDWTAATRRYSLHDLARDYADTRQSATEREQAGLLHAAHYLQLLATANDLYKKGNEAIAEGLTLFDNERVNIEAGQAWAAARFADDELAARLCSTYPGVGIYVLSLRQHPRDFIRWQEAALHAARKLRHRQREGVYLGSLGGAYRVLGETHTAIDYYKQALVIAREIGDKRNESVWLNNLGNAYYDLGEARTAINYYEQALIIAREIGDRRDEGNWLGNLGLAYTNLGETRTAIDYHKQALAIAHELGDKRGEGSNLGNLGIAYRDLGEVRTAIDYHEQALIISREIGDKFGEGADLSNLGIVYAELGETEKAIGFIEAALKIFEEIESPHANTVRSWLEKLRGQSG